MKESSIDEVFNLIRNGANIQQNKVEEGIPITRIESIVDNQFDLTRLGYAGITSNEYSNYYLENGDILMSHINSVSHLGKVALVKNTDSPIIHGMNLLCLKANNELLAPEYAWFFFKTSIFKNRIKTITKNSVNQASFNISGLKKIKIPIPPLSHQIRIAEVLSKAEALIEQRKESIALLDEYLKSTFLEMFGDPVRNEKGWKIDILENNSTKISSGSTPLGGREVYQREGVYFIRSQNVRMNFLDYSDIYCISEEIHNNMKRTWIKNEDILLNITGASIGRVATYYGEDNIANVNQHVCIIRTIKEKLNPRFIEYQIANEHFQKISIGASTGGTRESFTFEIIKKFKIILPPIQIQNKFESIVQQTELLKKRYQESLAELQNIYSVLSQKAFKGELKLDKSITVPKVIAFEPEDSYYEKRTALACYMITQSLSDPQFGDVKFQKLLHLVDYTALKRNLNQKYFQKTAGPFDNTFTIPFLEEIEKKKWFIHEKTDAQSVFKSGKKHNEIIDVNTYFSKEELNKIDQLIVHFKTCNYEEPEIISTMYAVWNNRLIKQEPITDELLKQDFLNWDKKKSRYKDRLDNGLAWMRKNNIIPDGWGKVIEKPKGQK